MLLVGIDMERTIHGSRDSMGFLNLLGIRLDLAATRCRIPRREGANWPCRKLDRQLCVLLGWLPGSVLDELGVPFGDRGWLPGLDSVGGRHGADWPLHRFLLLLR